MTKQEFLDKCHDINEKRRQLYKQLLAAKAGYVLTNKAVSIGDKVALTVKTWDWNENKERIESENVVKGYVRSIQADDQGRIIYGYYKVKKDGTRSKARLNIWSNIIKIEKI